MRILVLGGDGYLGWPTALHLSAAGHDVAVADNFARRGYDRELGVTSLVSIASLERRVSVWREVSGRQIDDLRRGSDRPRFHERDDRLNFVPTRSCTSPSSVRRPTR